MGCHPGNYVIEAEQFDQEKHYHVRQKLVVGDEKVESVILTLGRGTTMYGHLGSLGPMPKLDQVRVALELIDDSQEESFDWAEIKKDGSFLFFDVADGSYALHLYGLQDTWYVKSARAGGTICCRRDYKLRKDLLPVRLS